MTDAAGCKCIRQIADIEVYNKEFSKGRLMMPSMFFVFNHTILPVQERDARDNLGVEHLYELPQELKIVWEKIPPENDDILSVVSPIIAWLDSHSLPGDYVLVQGDFGATFLVVGWALKHDRIPVYATTRRIFESRRDESGAVVNVHRFEHVRYRKYNLFL